MLDLGAGTGKLTRALVETGARVLAVEPGDEMRAQLAACRPEVEPMPQRPRRSRCGTAHRCGYGRAAFHWFRLDEALPRCTASSAGRGLALVGTRATRTSVPAASSGELLRPFLPDGRPCGRSRAGDRGEPPVRTGSQGNEPLRHELDAAASWSACAPISFVAAAPAEQRELERQVARAVVDARTAARPVRAI